jgi:hypothetical protein
MPSTCCLVRLVISRVPLSHNFSAPTACSLPPVPSSVSSPAAYVAFTSKHGTGRFGSIPSPTPGRWWRGLNADRQQRMPMVDDWQDGGAPSACRARDRRPRQCCGGYSVGCVAAQLLDYVYTDAWPIRLTGRMQSSGQIAHVGLRYDRAAADHSYTNSLASSLPADPARGPDMLHQPAAAAKAARIAAASASRCRFPAAT